MTGTGRKFQEMPAFMIFDSDLTEVRNLKNLTLISQPVAPLGVNCIFLISNTTRNTFIIDPGGSVPLIRSIILKHELIPEAILLTHGHFDHVGAVDELCDFLEKPPKIMIHKSDEDFCRNADKSAARFGIKMASMTSSITQYLTNEMVIRLDETEIFVIHTPGHSKGSCCFYIPDEKILISGDTLFQEGIGRTDLPGGNYEELINSIHTKLYTLEDRTLVIPGHGDFTTIKDEKEGNPYAATAL
jgi:hydroxyacylglutathione hydrolase